MLNRFRSAVVRWLAPEIRAQVSINAEHVSPAQLAAVINRQNADFARRLPALIRESAQRRA